MLPFGSAACVTVNPPPRPSRSSHEHLRPPFLASLQSPYHERGDRETKQQTDIFWFAPLMRNRGTRFIGVSHDPRANSSRSICVRAHISTVWTNALLDYGTKKYSHLSTRVQETVKCFAVVATKQQNEATVFINKNITPKILVYTIFLVKILLLLAFSRLQPC